MDIIIQSVNDDWERLIINDKIAVEGHSITCYQTVIALLEAGVINNWDITQEEVEED